MQQPSSKDQRFGDIAVKNNFVSREKLERALVVRRCIYNRTNVHMHIGKVMVTMGVLTQAQVDQILAAQKYVVADDPTPDPPKQTTGKGSALVGLDLAVSADKLRATLTPTGEDLSGIGLEDVKGLLANRKIVYGIASDSRIKTWLDGKPTSAQPFRVATGTPAQPGEPAEIRYHFDTDPMRIGTLQEDGTMDWKNRGDIPQVKVGDVLAEKIGGRKGVAGTSVYGKPIPPPRVKDPALKGARGSQRSEDGLQILAKTDGSPKLTPDGKIGVLAMLPIKGDIGLETGHVDFEGHIEVPGTVTSGYRVNGVSLRAKEVQNATVTLQSDCTVYGGIYGTTISAGGSLKASHLHSCKIEILGDLVVEKEIYGCTIETNGRLIIGGGNVIASKIAAKKGIQVLNIGTEAAKPSELTVGIDRKYQRDLKALKEKVAALEQQRQEKAEAIAAREKQLDGLSDELGEIAQVQDGFMVQQRQLEERLEGLEPVNDETVRRKIQEAIDELAQKRDDIDRRVEQIMTEEDEVRDQIAAAKQAFSEQVDQLTATNEEITILMESAKVDPGTAVIKVGGSIFAKTAIKAPHSALTTPEDMKHVRISEAKENPGGRYYIKISSLR